jgi:hypothetical protein
LDAQGWSRGGGVDGGGWLQSSWGSSSGGGGGHASSQELELSYVSDGGFHEGYWRAKYLKEARGRDLTFSFAPSVRSFSAFTAGARRGRLAESLPEADHALPVVP